MIKLFVRLTQNAQRVTRLKMLLSSKWNELHNQWAFRMKHNYVNHQNNLKTKTKWKKLNALKLIENKMYRIEPKRGKKN